MSSQSWDDEVALMAQTHAQQCVFTHDTDRNVGKLYKLYIFLCKLVSNDNLYGCFQLARFKVGQNLGNRFQNLFF